jgi:hypothetical protein
MGVSVDEVSKELRDALVEAYRPYVEDRLREAGVEMAPHLDALREAEDSMAEALDELLGQPYERQRRGPLELFQEAMVMPTAVLQEAGIEPRPRDEVAEAALPGDLYDLAPASSRTLGESVWMAHLRWGASKAAAMRTGGGD